jgi:hypothetical protein
MKAGKGDGVDRARSPINVLLSSTSYPRTADDWQGRFIADMVVAIGRREDIDLKLWAPAGDRAEHAEFVGTSEEARWLSRLADSGGIASQLRTGFASALPAATGLLRRLRRVYRRVPCHLVHANWLQNALPLWRIDRPLLVTVLGRDFALLDIPGMRSALRRVFRERRTVIAPNAPWMAGRLEECFGDVATIRPVPFGVAAQWFTVDRSAAEGGLWIAVTRLTAAKIGALFEWGEGLFDKERQLHLFGPMQERVEVPSWVRWHGPTHPSELRERWFPHAAALITLSRHDEGRPQVMLEAMAAGLPVVASDLPAHRDFVRHGETGFVVADREGLRDALQLLEDPEKNRRLGSSARDWIGTTVGTWDDCADRYVRLYRELLTS